MAKDLLVVEDDADTREVLTELLVSEGYVVRTAADGAEALAAMSEGPLPALILLDVMMPICDGIEFLLARQTRPRLAAPPVLVLSGMGEDIAALEGADLNVRGILRKPFSPETLFSMVREQVGSQA